MGLVDIGGTGRNGPGVEPDGRALAWQAPVHHHAVAGFLGAIAELVEAARIAHRHADVAVGDVGHVLGGIEVGHVGADLQHQRRGLFVVLGVGAVGIQAQVVQHNRQDVRGRVQHGHAATLELGHVLRLEHQVPAVHRCVRPQRRLDLGRVEADEDGAVHVGHAVLVARVVDLQQLEQLGIEILPVGQLALVQLLEYAGLDLGFQELVGGNHQVIAGAAGEQLGLQRLVAVEGIPGDADAGLLGEVLGRLGQDVVGPVVDPQFAGIGGLDGGGEQGATEQGGERTQEAVHGRIPRDRDQAPSKAARTFTVLMPISATA